MKSTRTWSVGEVAERFGLGAHVLRYWEEVGLLTPGRDAAGRRRYDADDVVRVGVVLRSKAAGMTLEQVKVMLDAGAPARHRVLVEHVAELDRRMADMAHARAMALHALSCRSHDIATCPQFRSHVVDLLEGRPWPHAEVAS